MLHSTPDTISLVHKHIEMFNNDSTVYCELMVTAPGHRGILHRAYNRFVREKKITALQDMTMSEKVSVGEMAKEIAKGRLDRASLIELAENLIVIEYLLNLKKN